MANKVVLDENEVNTFTENLILYHSEIITGIDKVKGQMGFLNAGGDIFKMDKTSQKIRALLDTIDQDVLKMLYNTLGQSNQCTNLLVQIMNGLDS